MSAPEHSKPVRLSWLALKHAIAEDSAKTKRAMERLATECGAEGTYVALMTWVDAYADHSTAGDSTGRVAPIRPWNAVTGSMGDEGMPDRVKWALRLIHARAAMDEDAFNAALDDLPADQEAMGSHVIAVLDCIALTMRTLPRGYAKLGGDPT